jgi:hypothetical protein
MSDNVVSLAPALPMVAIIIAAKESGFHPDRIERLVRESYSGGDRGGDRRRLCRGGLHMRDVGKALLWPAR